MKLITGLFDRLLFAAAFAAFLQIPQFVDHYTQRFGGYRQALLESVAHYQHSANQHYAGDLLLMVHEFRSSPQPALRELGDKIAADNRRLDDMSRGIALLENGSLLDKLLYLATHLDPAIARGTLAALTPGLPLTLDAMICGLIGAVSASLLFNGLGALLQALRRLAPPVVPRP